MFAFRGDATLRPVVLIPRSFTYEAMRSETSLWSIHWWLWDLACSCFVDVSRPLRRSDIASVHKSRSKDSLVAESAPFGVGSLFPSLYMLCSASRLLKNLPKGGFDAIDVLS